MFKSHWRGSSYINSHHIMHINDQMHHSGPLESIRFIADARIISCKGGPSLSSHDMIIDIFECL